MFKKLYKQLCNNGSVCCMTRKTAEKLRSYCLRHGFLNVFIFENNNKYVVSFDKFI